MNPLYERDPLLPCLMMSARWAYDILYHFMAGLTARPLGHAAVPAARSTFVCHEKVDLKSLYGSRGEFRVPSGTGCAEGRLQPVLVIIDPCAIG